MRDGTGNPPLCRAHRVILSSAAQAPARRGSELGQKIGDLFHTFLSGNKITPDHLAAVAEEATWAIGGHMAPGYFPEIDPRGHSRFDPPAGFRPPPGWDPNADPRGGRRATPPPPPEPEIDPEIETARRRARQVLGWSPSSKVTEDEVRAKRKELARRYHPDRKGGSLEKMKLVNEACDILVAELESARQSAG